MIFLRVVRHRSAEAVNVPDQIYPAFAVIVVPIGVKLELPLGFINVPLILILVCA